MTLPSIPAKEVGWYSISLWREICATWKFWLKCQSYPGTSLKATHEKQCSATYWESHDQGSPEHVSSDSEHLFKSARNAHDFPFICYTSISPQWSSGFISGEKEICSVFIHFSDFCILKECGTLCVPQPILPQTWTANPTGLLPSIFPLFKFHGIILGRAFCHEHNGT